MTLLAFAQLLACLLVAFQVKHFLADYPLQNSFMLGKFKPGWGFAFPLACHAGVHALLTVPIFLLAGAPLTLALWLAGLDFVLHFVMDRVKASPRLMGRWKPLTAEGYVENYRMANAPLTFDTPSGDAARMRLRGNILFWWALGFDQGFHHLTHYLLIGLFVLTVVL